MRVGINRLQWAAVIIASAMFTAVPLWAGDTSTVGDKVKDAAENISDAAKQVGETVKEGAVTVALEIKTNAVKGALLVKTGAVNVATEVKTGAVRASDKTHEFLGTSDPDAIIARARAQAAAGKFKDAQDTLDRLANLGLNETQRQAVSDLRMQLVGALKNDPTAINKLPGNRK